MSDQNGHFKGGHGSDFERCSEKLPCPICQSPGWCQVIGGTLVQCMKERTGAFKHIEQKDGSIAYFHRLKIPGVDPMLPAAPPADRAPPEIIHAVYDSLLGALSLSFRSPRRVDLHQRGLTDELIKRLRYRDFT